MISFDIDGPAVTRNIVIFYWIVDVVAVDDAVAVGRDTDIMVPPTDLLAERRRKIETSAVRPHRIVCRVVVTRAIQDRGDVRFNYDRGKRECLTTTTCGFSDLPV